MDLPRALSMSLPRAHQVIAIEVEDNLACTDYTDNIGIYIGHRVAGDLEGEQLPGWMSVVLAEFLEIVSYLAVAL
jgi:hypothetical protein